MKPNDTNGLKEIEYMIRELQDDISTLGVEACKSLNYGNVPEENFKHCISVLLERDKLLFLLEDILELKKTIINNAK